MPENEDPSLSGKAREPLPRVGFVTTELGAGGAEKVVCELARRLPRDRFEVAGVWCLAPADGFHAEVLVGAGIPVRGAGIRGILGAPSGLLRLRSGLRGAGLDLLSAHLFHAGLAARLAVTGRPAPRLVVTHHLPEVRGWRHRVERHWPGRVAAYTAVSATVAGSMVEGLGLPPGSVRVIPNGVDAGAFARDMLPERSAARRRLGLPEGARVVGAVGRLVPEKDPLALLEAFAILAAQDPELHLLWVGDGPLRGEIRQRGESLGLAGRVALAGFLPDVREGLAAMDAFAMPSRSEGQGLALLEALAAGLPAVATDIPAFRETAGDPGRAARLVSPGDAAGMAGALRSILADAQQARQLGEAGRALVRERFPIDAMVGGYADLFAGVLAGRSA